MKTLGVSANASKARAGALLDRILPLARQHGARVIADPQTAALADGIEPVPFDRLFAEADVVMAPSKIQ